VLAKVVAGVENGAQKLERSAIEIRQSGPLCGNAKNGFDSPAKETQRCLRSEQRMSTTQTVLDLDQVCVNTMRTLAIDAIQQANSGHPARRWHVPTVYCLWQGF